MIPAYKAKECDHCLGSYLLIASLSLSLSFSLFGFMFLLFSRLFSDSFDSFVIFGCSTIMVSALTMLQTYFMLFRVNLCQFLQSDVYFFYCTAPASSSFCMWVSWHEKKVRHQGSIILSTCWLFTPGAAADNLMLDIQILFSYNAMQ